MALLDLRWILVVCGAALAFGSLSPLIAVRRMYFLAGGFPHAALLAALLAIPLSRMTGIPVEVWAALVATIMALPLEVLLARGVDPDVATSVFVCSTASATVLVMYYVLTAFPLEADLWAYVLGDPLLTEWDEAITTALMSFAVALAVLATFRGHVILGVDRDVARLVGVNARAYDALLLSLIAVTSVIMLRAVGFILEHVLLLLPGATAANLSASACKALKLSIALSLVVGAAGLALAVIFNLAPAGVTGMLALSAYLASLKARRRW